MDRDALMSFYNSISEMANEKIKESDNGCVIISVWFTNKEPEVYRVGYDSWCYYWDNFCESYGYLQYMTLRSSIAMERKCAHGIGLLSGRIAGKRRRCRSWSQGRQMRQISICLMVALSFGLILETVGHVEIPMRTLKNFYFCLTMFAKSHQNLHK